MRDSKGRFIKGYNWKIWQTQSTITPIERFLSKIHISDINFFEGTACWEWTASQMKGYGKFSILHKDIASHRFIYEYYHGEIDPKLTIDHLCKNPSCSNIMHLEQVSIGVNVSRSNNVTAINARKTHCIRGHELIGDNLYLYQGRRKCKTCKSIASKEWQQNHKEYNRVRRQKYVEENRDEVNRRRRELRQIKKNKILN